VGLIRDPAGAAKAEPADTPTIRLCRPFRLTTDEHDVHDGWPRRTRRPRRPWRLMHGEGACEGKLDDRVTRKHEPRIRLLWPFRITTDKHDVHVHDGSMHTHASLPAASAQSTDAPSKDPSERPRTALCRSAAIVDPAHDGASISPAGVGDAPDLEAVDGRKHGVAPDFLHPASSILVYCPSGRALERRVDATSRLTLRKGAFKCVYDPNPTRPGFCVCRPNRPTTRRSACQPGTLPRERDWSIDRPATRGVGTMKYLSRPENTRPYSCPTMEPRTAARA
jgi:hypothetical protein